LNLIIRALRGPQKLPARDVERTAGLLPYHELWWRATCNS